MLLILPLAAIIIDYFAIDFRCRRHAAFADFADDFAFHAAAASLLLLLAIRALMLRCCCFRR